MALKIDLNLARTRLSHAVELAKAGEISPEWIAQVEQVWDFSAKTYVSALGTTLLAKSTEPQIDPDSIKEQPGNPRSYSMRSLCHSVLVPDSYLHEFSIRTTGREPLNNQPFFRYLHLEEVERVRSRNDFAKYRGLVRQIDTLSQDETTMALASFVFVGIEKKRIEDALAEVSPARSASQLLANLETLLADGVGGPWIIQSLGSVLMENIYPAVKTRKLNDPSRDFPGDVQGLDESGNTIASLEARNKTVTESDVRSFVSKCAGNSIRRSIILQAGPQTERLNSRELFDWASSNYSISLHLIFGIDSAILQLFAWSPLNPETLIQKINSQFADRLREIEAPPKVRKNWTMLCASHHDT